MSGTGEQPEPVVPGVDAARLVAVLTAVTHALEAERDHLTELDAAVGDGDLGASVATAARAVRESLREHPDDIGRILSRAAAAVSDAAGATIGALLSIGLLRAARVANGQTVVGLAEIAAMMRAAEDGIREKGKADVGDKTLLDALVPAREALDAAVLDGLTGVEAAARAADAALRGATATAGMTPRFGRARWLPERAAGHRDPGAILVYLLVKSVAGR
ncbi:DAK2 domain-containing protein [Phytohabitans kaempferiae]|uniref:DAK2 domain-containing protein n=1 Tax=Phytohabitans kaempferiae TaxID=1620943 RepID=A0ABV6M9U9_9ACTN